MTVSRSRGIEPEEYPLALGEQQAALQASQAVRHFAVAREHLGADPYRPLYHLSPPYGIMNDPNGLCEWRGKYHLFYQFSHEHGDRVHWAHVVSDDLIHWQDMPLALHPTFERDCFSGQTLVEPDRVIAMYHGTEAGNCIATASDPLLLNWKKHPRNPVIPIVPVDEHGAPYRVFDPCLWKEGDHYYALSGTYKDGAFLNDCRNVEHLFESEDLETWRHLGPLVEDGFFTEPGEDGAVPNFWPVGNGKYMLLFYSHKRAAQYYIGVYDPTTHRFAPESHGRLNYGPIRVGSLHAPSATVDSRGRLLGIFNVQDGRATAGWSNLMTLPRRFSLDANNNLLIDPIDAVESLRFDHIHLEARVIPANDEVVLAGVQGKAMEIEAVIDQAAAREVGVCVLRSPDGSEKTRISLFRQVDTIRGHSALQIDVSAASVGHEVLARTPETGPVAIEEREPLHLRVFVDRSIVEVFANGRQCLSLRAYPERDDSRGVSVFARGADAKLISLSAWQMRSIWPELRGREGD